MGRIERYRGCLLGLAAGDARGTTLESTSPGTFEPLDDIVGGLPFNLKPGQWADDTSLAEALHVYVTRAEPARPLLLTAGRARTRARAGQPLTA